MTSSSQPRPTRKPRRDGWTFARRRQFLGHLSRGLDVRRACARVGLSRRSAYHLRGRDAGFARAWDAARRAARAAGEQRLFALLADRPWAAALVSGSGAPAGYGILPHVRVPGVPSV